jgi:hypothetical protein
MRADMPPELVEKLAADPHWQVRRGVRLEHDRNLAVRLAAEAAQSRRYEE